MTPRLGDKVLVSGALNYIGGPVIVSGREVPGEIVALDQGRDKDRVHVRLEGGRSRNRQLVQTTYDRIRSAEA